MTVPALEKHIKYLRMALQTKEATPSEGVTMLLQHAPATASHRTSANCTPHGRSLSICLQQRSRPFQKPFFLLKLHN